MLITLCYSVLTFYQSRQRREIQYWVVETATKRSSLLLLRKPTVLSPSTPDTNDTGPDPFLLATPSRSRSRSSISPSRNGSDVGSASSENPPDYKQDSELTSGPIKVKKLLWVEEDVTAIALYPLQAIHLHNWTAFQGLKIEDPTANLNNQKFYILLEADPGATEFPDQYRKFCQFGEIIAWRTGGSIALILHSGLGQLVDLMHIFRLGGLILEGGWSVFRLTTVKCEGFAGTLISKAEVSSNSLNAGDLRRLSSGILRSERSFESSTSVSTPKNTLTPSNDKYDLARILEENLNGVVEEGLPNWGQRSPKKRSIPAFSEQRSISNTPRRRVSSICGGSLSLKSSSFASLLLCSRSASVEEEESRVGNSSNKRKSLESLPLESKREEVGHRPPPESPSVKSLFTPYKMTPHRLGKPPNILVLCSDSKLRGEIASLLKNILANDRYIIYEIRWDQLCVGGWSEQAALLVVSGIIPDSSSSGLLLQFLGDGGRILAWCCESHPLGLAQPKKSTTSATLSYGNNLRTGSPLVVSSSIWSSSGGKDGLPTGFPRVLETTDSEGCSRLLTTSTFARVEPSKDPAILYLDGGALGGKAILSQVHFESTPDEEGAQSLLSHLLSQNLSVDCTRIVVPDYTQGFLLGDHQRVSEFLKGLPRAVQQSQLTLEFIPRGVKIPTPSPTKLPIVTLSCPENFSTLAYYNNLNTKELGRIVIFSDVMTSTMHVLNGHPLGHGVVVVARRQTTGKGRGKNIWLSPEGCASYALQLFTTLNSQIGKRISLIQHLAALSVILAIPRRKEIKIQVKWPNDIYLDGQKIGGILVESRLEGSKMSLSIGVGVNVSNSYPTASLNSVLPDSDKLSIESFIARALTQFEGLLDKIESDPEGGLETIFNIYKENWVHNYGVDELVRVEVEPGVVTECTIQGIDEFGFLKVVEINSGNMFSVQPDGNSFDIANRLIAIK